MKRIFLLEDDPNIFENLVAFLRAEGYAVEHFDSVRKASAAEVRCDLMILDWTLPDGSGLDFLKNARSRKIHTPAIFLTARNDLVSKVTGLEVGADDYLIKPFEPQELLARIRAVLRRGRAAGGDALEHGDISVDLENCRVRKGGKEIPLARKEFELLRFLLENKGRVFSRDELLNAVWGVDSLPVTRTVDMHVASLRAKLGETLIETVRGFGYRCGGRS